MKTEFKKMKITNRFLGLSLIELIIAFSVVGLVSLLVASVYFAHFRLFNNQNTSIEVSSQNRLALDEITNQIRQSESIVNTCTGCSGDTTSPTVLILRLWPQDSSGEPIDPGSSAYDFIIYKRDPTDNTKFTRKIIADAVSSRTSDNKIIATNTSDLQFSYDNADPTLASQVTITIATTANSGGKTITKTQSASAVLRNK